MKILIARNKTKAHIKQMATESISVLAVDALVRGTIFGLIFVAIAFFLQENRLDLAVISGAIMALFTFLMSLLERYLAARQL